MRLFLPLSFMLCSSLLGQSNNSKNPSDKKPVFLNPAIPLEERVSALVSRMTLEEKVSQMVNASAAIPRLNIPAYNWWNECLHGVARNGIATVFPQAIGLAATWNTDLMFSVADAISTEARAKYNEALRENDRNIFKGLTFWSPNINLFRDPRWGRGQETYGEDPFLTSRMGVAFVKGLQGKNPKYFKVISTPKHYAVHSGPEPDRHTFNAIISSGDLWETYLPAFEACVKEGGAFSVMCAYNRFMGDACCGSPTLLRKILRDDWGFKGYVVSDCGAVTNIYKTHKIVNTAPEAAALAVQSGTDLECGQTYSSSLIAAVKEGLLTENDINVALKRLFTARFKLGMFDPPDIVPYSKISMKENDSPEHRRLALEAARESIVLLKNENHVLPLKKNLKRIAVIGPTADSYFMLLGNYNGTPSKYVTPLQGIRDKAGDSTEVVYDTGCNLVEEGPAVQDIQPTMLSSGGATGLKAEYFNNSNLSGTPFFTRINQFSTPNWIYGSRTPSFNGSSSFSSIRWSGTLTMPESGDFRFIVKSDNGYRLSINNVLVVEDWNNRSLTAKSGIAHVEKGKPYALTVESALGVPRSQLYVQWERLETNHFQKVIELARNSDAVIFVGGITSQLEGEEMPVNLPGFKGGDRTTLNLPKVQEDLLKALHATGTPVILVLTSGSALAVNWEEENLPAIIQLWYPGEEGGAALADVLFGDYNPAGRLPVTFYKSVEQLPPFEDYNMAPDSLGRGRTYRYFTGKPLYPFGFGLSYTSFDYLKSDVDKAIARENDTLKVSVAVRNSGKRDGDDVVQLYVSKRIPSEKNLDTKEVQPIKSLKGFKRVSIKKGETTIVEISLPVESLRNFSMEKNKYVVEPGTYELQIGSSSDDIKLKKIITVVE
ncbi:MAG: glycoside hydrolase family 3 C-terminal domain-containing protein [Bacteroidota bacterium]|nr:glycoside hydrolase family 3 C-terminal domain-containing protein [Bacteroidota bacterium]